MDGSIGRWMDVVPPPHTEEQLFQKISHDFSRDHRRLLCYFSCFFFVFLWCGGFCLLVTWLNLVLV